MGIEITKAGPQGPAFATGTLPQMIVYWPDGQLRVESGKLKMSGISFGNDFK